MKIKAQEAFMGFEWNFSGPKLGAGPRASINKVACRPAGEARRSELYFFFVQNGMRLIFLECVYEWSS